MLGRIFGVVMALPFKALDLVWTAGERTVAVTQRLSRNARLQAEQRAVEAELDRKQDELRGTILRLAEALGAEAHEARKALIRESYLASGRVPERPTDS